MIDKTKAEHLRKLRERALVPYSPKPLAPTPRLAYSSPREDTAMLSEAGELRWLRPDQPLAPEPILPIPPLTRRWIVVGSLGLIGAVALAVTVVSLNDMAEGFQAALALPGWKAWILALLADILFIGIEALCIFAPRELVAWWVTRALRSGAILISMVANAYSLSWVAPIPAVGIAAGFIMPLAIAGCTYVIGFAVHRGGR